MSTDKSITDEYTSLIHLWKGSINNIYNSGSFAYYLMKNNSSLFDLNIQDPFNLSRFFRLIFLSRDTIRFPSFFSEFLAMLLLSFFQALSVVNTPIMRSPKASSSISSSPTKKHTLVGLYYHEDILHFQKDTAIKKQFEELFVVEFLPS